MYRFFVALFLFSIKTSLVFAQNEHRLIEVYCASLFGEGAGIAASSVPLNTEWGKLVENLESRSLSDSAANDLASNAEYRRCLDEHSKDLELGEFIVSGLSAIRQSVKEFKNPEIESQSVTPSLFEEERKISTNELSLTLVTENRALVSFEAMKIDLELREQHYRGLWQQFVSDLKQKTLAQVAQSN